jgi:transposase
MEDKALYTQILGIQSPWEIEDIDLNMNGERVDIYVEWPAGIDALCPVCQKENKETLCKIHDRRKERVWRHLDTCQMKTFIHSHIPRVKCPEHGIKTISIEWADEMARFSHLFEGLAIHILKMSANRSQTAKVLRVSWDEINRIMTRAVERGLSRRENENILSIGIDEKSFLAGHSYVTVMTDNEGKRVMDVVEGRDEDAVDSLWQCLTEEQRKSIKSVGMDFWKAYISGTRRHAPQADIVYDRFHVTKHLNEAVDKVRKKEHRELCRKKNTSLAKTKYLWLKNPENWTTKEENRYTVLSKNQLAVGRAWNRKELFREFWALTTIEDAEIFFKRWYFSATHSRLKPIIEIAKMLKRHLEGLLTWIKHHISNGLAEGFNSKIQQIKSIARGFRDFNNYRIAILFHLGGLDLFPH